jgi:hypothetical protein
MAVVVEPQLNPDIDKRWSWPVYLATLRARNQCPTTLLVVCTTMSVARWCSTPIVMGHPNWVLTPLVLGPDRIPVVTDRDQATRMPELAVLSAMTHYDNPDFDKMLEAFLAGLNSVDDSRCNFYVDIVYSALPAAGRLKLEKSMNSEPYEPKAPFLLRPYREGETKALFTVLDSRGIAVEDDVRKRIEECDDIDLIDTWVRRAARAESSRELFD